MPFAGQILPTPRNDISSYLIMGLSAPAAAIGLPKKISSSYPTFFLSMGAILENTPAISSICCLV
ncbi:MAG: hypothetical protein EU535_06360 [Promethearchaeota archaeon]|nr:MAG: hypothetical protein EU535_06360 [Candidatus Lokiarchaeota archaeon]